MLPLVEDLNVKALHVQAPTNVVFLCGGPFSEKSKGKIKSLRDAFLRVSQHPALAGSEVILAETFTKQFEFSARYTDILQFEADLAQIAELIILFCESEGSFAELGAFARDDEISKRLLVIIRERYANSGSFIALGPIARLRNQFEHSVYTIDDTRLGIKGKSHAEVSLDELKALLDNPLKLRLANTREPSTFDRKRDGHLIKLIVGLVQDYGALTEKEIQGALRKLGVAIQPLRLGAYLLCAKAVGWLELQESGFGRYYVPKVESPAAQFQVPSTATVKGRVRRINHIREIWYNVDKQRFDAIQKSMKAIES
jgi:hypothetical protein